MSKQCHLVDTKRKKIGELAQMEIWASSPLWAPFLLSFWPSVTTQVQTRKFPQGAIKNNLNQIKTLVVFPL